MSDRLKLSDLKGDKRLDEIARKLIVDDLNAQAKALEQRNAELEHMLAEQTKKAQPASKSAKIGARKDDTFKAVSTAPSINKTPRGPAMVPVAYPTVQDLSNSIGTAKTVRFNGKPVYLLDSSSQPSCKGDDAGTGGGVRSGTVNGEVKPVSGSKSVRVEGKSVVREGDACTMNGGNNPGVYVTVPPQSGEPPKYAIETSNPAWNFATLQEHSALQGWLDMTVDEIGEALSHPVDAVKGAGKSVLNDVAALLELILTSGGRKRALDLEEAAAIQGALGNFNKERQRRETAERIRNGADRIQLPSFEMSNSAERGGATISILLQLATFPEAAVNSMRSFGQIKNLSKTQAVLTNAVEDGVKIRAVDKTSKSARREYLDRKFDRVGDLDTEINVRGRQETASKFFKSQGIKETDIPSYMNGIDFLQPVIIEKRGVGRRLWQFQIEGAPQGNWYSFIPDVQPSELGINPFGFNRTTETIELKIRNEFRTTDSVYFLRSTSAPVVDSWSMKSQPFNAKGGAKQLFSTNKTSISKINKND